MANDFSGKYFVFKNEISVGNVTKKQYLKIKSNNSDKTQSNHIQCYNKQDVKNYKINLNHT